MCTMMTVTVKTFWRQCDPPGWYFLNLLEFIPLRSYKCFLQLWKHHKIKGIGVEKNYLMFSCSFQEKKHPGIPPDLPWVWATWWGGLCEIQIFKFAATSDADFHLIWNPSKEGGGGWKNSHGEGGLASIPRTWLGTVFSKYQRTLFCLFGRFC